MRWNGNGNSLAWPVNFVSNTRSYGLTKLNLVKEGQAIRGKGPRKRVRNLQEDIHKIGGKGSRGKVGEKVQVSPGPKQRTRGNQPANKPARKTARGNPGRVQPQPENSRELGAKVRDRDEFVWPMALL